MTCNTENEKKIKEKRVGFFVLVILLILKNFVLKIIKNKKILPFIHNSYQDVTIFYHIIIQLK